ncbi:uncharacterized protein LOC127834675 isoform X2 [Dreissena polymorpha]|uniref:uncharacterized protein LOC127834675 isoform X2 n=1 Tax=Dreissena polymorpha TaxID=45954 RepID=UPI0022643996|nr:uncharacterized protein LOC127834675 isoform X2 [Dreissena polymorpha]
MSVEENEMPIEENLLVFVYHENCDIDEAKQLQIYLNSNNCTCKIYSQTNEPGKHLLQQLHGSVNPFTPVNQNQRVVFLITKITEETGLITFAVVAALEKVSLQTCMPIFIGYKGKSLTSESLKRGLLALTPSVFVDLDKESGFDSLLSRLKSSKYLAEDLPVGNLHHGLVYSHISGFMGYLVEELQKRLAQKCKEYEHEKKRLVDRFLLVIPETCEVPSGLLTGNESASICISKALKEGTTVDEIAFQREHAGKTRTYKVTIYKIKSENEEFYICAQVPTVLTAISQLAQKHLGKIDVGLEKQRFHLLYQQILDLKGWNDTVKLVSCKDEADIPRALFDAAKTLGTANEEVLDLQKATIRPDEQQRRVYLRYFESESDQKVGKDIARLLEENQIQTFTSLHGESVLSSPETHEGWVICVLSKAAQEDGLFSFNVMTDIQTSVDKCKLQVMLVLNGLQISDVPHCIKWVRFFGMTEDKLYLNGILRTVSDAPVDISKALPSGDVIPGLAWAYVQNYLMKTLTNTLGKRIEAYLEKMQIECGCIQTLVIVWIKSCNTGQWLTDLANKGVEKRQVVHLKEDLEPTIDEFGGQIGRPFNLNVFKFTDTRDPNNICSINILKQYPGKRKIIRLNINRTFVLTTDDRNDSMYDVSLNVVFMQIRSYDTKTQFCFTDHFGLEDWVSHVKYRK